MGSLSTVESELPPGFRFHPRDEELIYDYLMRWVTGCAPQIPFLIEVDLNKCEPWDIPETACVGGKEWYFYSQRDRKYATGLRTNRATLSGYWKATGKDRPIIRKGALIGMRKTLVFYEGRAPKGRKTDWVMHEFRLEGSLGPGSNTNKDQDWVLCRVFFKNRSEGKKESGGSSSHEEASSPSPTSFPPLTEEPKLIQTQVPCFSIFRPNQTDPTFSLLTSQHMEYETLPTNFGGLLPQDQHYPDLGSIYNNFDNNNNNNNTSVSLLNSSNPCSDDRDKKVIKAVLNHLTKMESGNHCWSFGEGSSDSYLSELGLSSMWNQYS